MIGRLQALLRGGPEILVGILHGSFHSGGPFRDVDVALYIDPGRIERTTFREYERDLGVRLSGEIGFSIDIRVLNDAPVAFRYHALKGTVLLVREADLLDELRAKTWDEYCDFVPFARRYLREAIGE
jgi:predicted nucleotidyltransferase